MKIALKTVVFQDYVAMNAPRAGDRDYVSITQGPDPQYNDAVNWTIVLDTETRLVVVTAVDVKGKADPEEYLVPLEYVRSMRRDKGGEFKENHKPVGKITADVK